MFAENEADELLFLFNGEGQLDMVETEYSKVLSGFMSQYLQGPNGSLAAFTAALTIELVNQMTAVTQATASGILEGWQSETSTSDTTQA